jgi:hypothetical protein
MDGWEPIPAVETPPVFGLCQHWRGLPVAVRRTSALHQVALSRADPQKSSRKWHGTWQWATAIYFKQVENTGRKSVAHLNCGKGRMSAVVASITHRITQEPAVVGRHRLYCVTLLIVLRDRVG